jgi:SRR1
MLKAVAIKELLEAVPSPERIVCLGLGSLVNGEARGRHISEVQLALLLALKKIMDVSPEPHGSDIQVPVVAYDPIFTSLDIEFLQSTRITVEVLLLSRIY